MKYSIPLFLWIVFIYQHSKEKFVICTKLSHQCDGPPNLYYTEDAQVEECIKNLYRAIPPSEICVYNSVLFLDGRYHCDLQLTDDNERSGCVAGDVNCFCLRNQLYCLSLGLTFFPHIVEESITWFFLTGNFLNGAMTNSTFDRYSRLVFLDISNNTIEKLEPFMFHNLDQLNVLNLRRNKITDVEQYVFSGLKNLDVLDLSENQITKLTSEYFSTLWNLTLLDLSNNKIVDVANTTFTDLKNLIVLDISKNLIETIPSNTLQNLKRLKLLFLQNNRIKIIENTTFNDLQNLLFLDLSHNKITRLYTNTFQYLSKALRIYLQFNQINYTENSTFYGLQDLELLNLSENQLTKVTLNILRSMKNLQSLLLSYNHISSVEGSIFNGSIQLEKIDLSNNRLSKLKSNTFNGMNKLGTIDLKFNQITNIEEFSFEGLQQLESLYLDDNKLKRLTSNVLHDVNNLSTLFFDNNEIETIEDFPFDKLPDLKMLTLSYNKITKLTANVFQNLTKLESLYVIYNLIETIDDNAFNGLSELRVIILRYNKLTTLTSNMFQNIPNLREVWFDYNEITFIEDFHGLKYLKTISLIHNKLTKIHPNMFKRLNLVSLSLSENQIHIIEDYSFAELRFLEQLNISNNKIEYLNDKTFFGLQHLTSLLLTSNSIVDIDKFTFQDNKWLKSLETDEFRICCLAKQWAKRLSECISPETEFSSCEDLMANFVLRMCIWILGIIAVVNNTYVIILRARHKHTTATSRIHSFLIQNLAVSDLLMGIYLLIIAAADLSYRGEYYLHDFKWRSSFFCSFAGFLSTFSSELSVFTLTVITVDRLLSIKFPYKNQNRGINRTRFLMAIGWICAMVISIIPLPIFQIEYFKNFYGRSGVCLALHITHEKHPGWLYSVLIFIVLNSLSFATIAISYIMMYWSVKKTRDAVYVANKAPKKGMAFQMSLLVIADALCWIPIIGLGIRSLMSYTMSPGIYAWIAVFVLPLNAALNPILYTLTSMECIQIRYQNSRFRGRLRYRNPFNWPCYWEIPNRPTSSSKSFTTKDTDL